MMDAVILAAGYSTRMGHPKMLLPWGRVSVLGKVITTLKAAGMANIWVISGGAREEVEAEARRYGARAQASPEGEMLASIQTGLSLMAGADAALIALGDQPQIKAETVKKLLTAWESSGAGIIVPSYQMRRGHPWVIAKPYWDEILALPANQSMRDFFRGRGGEILHIDTDTPSILQDLDTPEDYKKFRP